MGRRMIHVCRLAILLAAAVDRFSRPRPLKYSMPKACCASTCPASADFRYQITASFSLASGVRWASCMAAAGDRSPLLHQQLFCFGGIVDAGATLQMQHRQRSLGIQITALRRLLAIPPRVCGPALPFAGRNIFPNCTWRP